MSFVRLIKEYNSESPSRVSAYFVPRQKADRQSSDTFYETLKRAASFEQAKSFCCIS